MAITEGILRMIAADDSHAGSLTVARRGTGGHLQTPGLAAPEHSDAERPAPHLGQDGRASAPMGRRTRARSRYARPGGTGDTFRPPAWRHLNHGLLRGQLAGRDNTAGPSFVTVDRRTRAKGTALSCARPDALRASFPGNGRADVRHGSLPPPAAEKTVARCRESCPTALRESGNDLPPTVRRAPRNSRSCVERRALLLELEEPVFVAIDEGHQAGLDDVRRCAYGPPAEFAGRRLDQHPCDGFG